MGLKLQRVPAAQGLRWVREGLSMYLRWPLAYLLLFMLFMLAVSLVSLLPVVGSPLLMMAAPLLGLGYTMAARDASVGQTPHPRVFLQPWRELPVPRRRALLWVCVAYAITVGLVVLAGEALGAHAFFELLGKLSSGSATPEEASAGLESAELLSSGLVVVALLTLVNMVFWHAPTLVVWAGQGAGQAVFSSTLALWRTAPAFLVYGLGWMGVLLGFSTVLALLLPLLGQVLMGLMIMPLAMALAAAFYVSLYPCYRDSFGLADAQAPADPLNPAPGGPAG